MALAKALWLCLLPGISLVGTGSVHASNWLLKGPGCLCALQQAGGNFFPPPRGLGGGQEQTLLSAALLTGAKQAPSTALCGQKV